MNFLLDYNSLIYGVFLLCITFISNWSLFGAFLSGFFGAFSWVCVPEIRQRRSFIARTVIFFTLLVFGFPWWAIAVDAWILNSERYQIDVPVFWLLIHVFCLLAGCTVWLFWARYIKPEVNHFFHRMTRRSALERNQRTDVRDIKKHLPHAKSDYNPAKWLSADPLKKGLFIGLCERGKPVYIPYSRWRSSHIQVVGTSGCGKGVAVGMLLSQAQRAGEAIFVFDPKNDEWAPHVLRESARREGVPFFLINLEMNTPQLDLLTDATDFEVEEMLSSGFSLGDSGDIADHYRLKDRAAIRAISQLVNTGVRSVEELACNALTASYEKECEGAVFKLRELALCRAVSGVEGLDMRSVVQDGGYVYIIGSMDNARVLMAQKMLLVRLLQIVKKRDRIDDTPRQVCVFLDELKYLLCKKTLEGLGAARDKGLHFVMAHQSLADLRDAPKDLDPDAVVGAIVENCAIRIAYRVQNPDTALWLAKMSGEILVDEEVRRIEKNSGGAEMLTHDRVLRQSTRHLVDTNMLLNLPDRTAVIFGIGQPQFAHICPIIAPKMSLEVSAAPEQRITEGGGSLITPDHDYRHVDF